MQYYLVQLNEIDKCSATGICVTWSDAYESGIAVVNELSTSILRENQIVNIEADNG